MDEICRRIFSAAFLLFCVTLIVCMDRGLDRTGGEGGISPSLLEATVSSSSREEQLRLMKFNQPVPLPKPRPLRDSMNDPVALNSPNPMLKEVTDEEFQPYVHRRLKTQRESEENQTWGEPESDDTGLSIKSSMNSLEANTVAAHISRILNRGQEAFSAAQTMFVSIAPTTEDVLNQIPHDFGVPQIYQDEKRAAAGLSIPFSKGQVTGIVGYDTTPLGISSEKEEASAFFEAGFEQNLFQSSTAGFEDALSLVGTYGVSDDETGKSVTRLGLGYERKGNSSSLSFYTGGLRTETGEDALEARLEYQFDF